MNRLPNEARARIANALIEGNSLRSTARLCDVAFNTVLKFLPEIGQACEVYQQRTLVNLRCQRIQCDEVWSFCYAKQKNVPSDKQGQFGFGDVWTWVAMDADTKLVPSWRVGNRGAATAYEFIHDLAGRLANRVQLTTDGHRVYLEAVESAFGCAIDYAMLVKIYGADLRESEARYSPAECIGARIIPIIGKPDYKHISTSHIERQNLSMRMRMRRFTRLTNAFSKKVENHRWAIALYFMHYNFCRVHQTLRVTPAMEAGVSDHIWSVEELVAILDGKAKNAA